MWAIQAINLSKTYRLAQLRPKTLKELFLTRLLRPQPYQTIAALRDVNFRLEQGKTLAVIGPNGSGKTTLLKLIAGITRPTHGQLLIKGKVSALLELGIGFHPELSGTDNVFLYGSLLGIEAEQLRTKLPDIVSFAGLERFMAMPLKYYSTGMVVRLGFSVAIHLEPEVLLLDEIMAVGDQEFRLRSFQRLQEFKRQGKTLVLVTHNLEQAEKIADEFLWLSRGAVKMFGPPTQVLSAYLENLYERDEVLHEQLPFDPQLTMIQERIRMGNGKALIERIRILDDQGQPTWRLVPGNNYCFELTLVAHQHIASMECAFGFGRAEGSPAVTYLKATQQGVQLENLHGSYLLRIRFTPLLLLPGTYNINAIIYAPGKEDDPFDLHLRLYSFTVVGEAPLIHRRHLTLPAQLSLERN